MKDKMFLSYSYNDSAWVKQFEAALKNEGLNAWSGFNMQVGGDIREEIESTLRASSTFIILLSSNSIKNNWVFFEFGAAVAGNKRIIPIVIDDIGNEKLPLPITRYQFLRESSPLSAAKMVAKAIKNENGE